MTDLPPDRDSDGDETGTPRWVKVFGIIAIVVVLAIVILHLTGHSSGGHSHE
jgi:hypothetical protein